MRAILLSCLFAAAASAQVVVVDHPNLASPTNIDRPFGGGLGRYQQWYNPTPVLTGAIAEPMRIQQIEFLCGSNNTQAPQPVTVDCEVLIGHGKFSGVFGTFDNNWDSTPLQVFGPTQLSLTVGPPGSVACTIPFGTFFTWDRVRPILIEPGSRRACLVGHDRGEAVQLRIESLDTGEYGLGHLRRGELTTLHPATHIAQGQVVNVGHAAASSTDVLSKILPGLRIPLGSRARLIVLISSISCSLREIPR